nr:hypothetical protein [Hoylesella enoeca]
MKKYIFLSAALLLLTASCSNDDNNNETKEPTQAVQFSFTNEDFGEDETLTRTAAGAKPQIVDLGDCEAEITVESEPTAKTRGALSPANGHYTIRAYQSGVLKGEMKGTFSWGYFTPDASSKDKLKLPYGTYDFVAFNDDVTVSGTNLTTPRAKAETARMGFATVNITSPTPIKVLFTMKHVGCRLRTQFICQKHIPENITATLEQTAANVIPASVAYNPATKTYTSTNGAMTAEASNSPASTEAKYTASNAGETFAYTSTSDYHYFLPTTAGNKLKLNFSAGTVFWKPLTGTIPQLNATLQMQSNKSYVVKIKLKPMYTYLFHDGTTGFLKDKGTRTPIGIVISPHLAVALNYADNGNKHEWDTVYGFVNSTNYDNNISGALSWNEGYNQTWNGTYSINPVGTIKANEKNKFPAFYYAAHYDQDLVAAGITVSGNMVGRKWYLPSSGEWSTANVALGFADAGFPMGTYAFMWSIYNKITQAAFIAAGGSKDDSDENWSSTEGIHYTAFSNNAWSSAAMLSLGGYKINKYKIRAFIKYKD